VTHVRSRLIPVTVPSDPLAAVLVLHGGASRGGGIMVSPTQLSVLRMIPIAHRVARAGRGRLAVYRLLNSVRGWDSSHTPVDDARWALDQVRDRLGDAVPFGLVGHSLGGRAALLSAGQRGVKSVVALAPWVYADDDVNGIEGRRILVVHGTSDRTADFTKAEIVTGRLARRADVSFVSVRGGTHAMLRHHAQFDGLAARFMAATLLRPTVEGSVGGPIARVLAGERWLQI
jgi:pimeloyl-ACP methyl ester carboxylesterase